MDQAELKKTLDDYLRDLTGNVQSNDKVTNLLYKLMKDHLPVGVVEDLVLDTLNVDVTTYRNGHLAEYAAHLSDLLEIKGPIEFEEVVEDVE